MMLVVKLKACSIMPSNACANTPDSTRWEPEKVMSHVEKTRVKRVDVDATDRCSSDCYAIHPISEKAPATKPRV
jgi:hypothetical protein